ncbi:MAG: hypothetical protein A4E53_00801 [Pelotomaculum sp. PtaB.Bin104]|nr:MAG: hypothetical protein A4E53_00801 [Pelotomaculum sp. PtaB.Bin104]
MAWRKLSTIFMACALVALAAGYGAGSSKTSLPTGVELATGGPLLEYFQATHPGQEAIVYSRADVNNDQGVDLVVIFRAGKENNAMLAVLGFPGSYQCTNEVPAPVSDQVIQFKDIDDKPPLEFIVQGRKGTNYGYAIYRVEGTNLEDLFGEGMKDCC